jgi:hypothetical protein
MHNIYLAIVVVGKILYFKNVGRSPEVDEGSSGEKQHGKNKNKGKGKTNPSRKSSKGKTRQPDAPKDKNGGKPIVCWIY